MTQTILSSNGSLCIATNTIYSIASDNDISFKKGELLQLGTNRWEIQSLETGHKGIILTGQVGYSKLELLQLFQFVMSEEELNIHHPVLQKIRSDLDSDDDKAALFLQSIDDDPTLLVTLRREIFTFCCKYIVGFLL